jgi:hypothetical protein
MADAEAGAEAAAAAGGGREDAMDAAGPPAAAAAAAAEATPVPDGNQPLARAFPVLGFFRLFAFWGFAAARCCAD